MFHNIIDKEVEISFHIIDSLIRSFCVVCHTKSHLPVHVLLGHIIVSICLIYIKLRKQ